jgi:proteasome lid subunit RPN8/RPN11
VNAQAQAYEYMTTYTESCEPVGRLEKVIGWYHSHPGLSLLFIDYHYKTFSRLWLLAQWDRRGHTGTQSTVSRAISCRCG